jgi:hypothetical protein
LNRRPARRILLPGGVMADTSTCTKRQCATVTPGLVATCPACGARTVTSRRIRILGWVGIACGLFLVGLMGYVTLVMYPTLTNVGVDMGARGRWTGTAEQARMALNLFYSVIGFGVLALAAGIWMVVTGRRHILITVITLLAAAALFLQTWETTEAFEQAQEAEEPPLIVQPPSMAPVNLAEPAPDKPQ